MKAEDLHLLNLLELDPGAGRIQFRNRRMLLWDADAFGNLRKELIESLGLDHARATLRRFGFANGYRDALTTRELFRWDDEREWWLSCPALQRHQGKVIAVPQHLVVDRAARVFEMEVVWQDSYEAAQHLRVWGPAAEPVCWTLAGFASGFSSALMGEEVLVIEQECAAAGAAHCRVIGRTLRAWGEQGDKHATEYAAGRLSLELEEREAELRRARRSRSRNETPASRGELSRFGLVAKSYAMTQVLEAAETLARADASVLLLGAEGTGKETIARFIHERSARSEREFVSLSCSAIPAAVLEAELFGPVDSDRTVLERAAGGTLYLADVEALSAEAQAQILSLLKTGNILLAGASAPQPLDVRIIAGSRCDLDAAVSHGDLRSDLLFRLRTVSLELPRLAERRADILPLAHQFIKLATRTYELPPRTLSPEAAEALTEYGWPGNVRELRNIIERSVVVAGHHPQIGLAHLPREVRDPVHRVRHRPSEGILPMAEVEKRYVLQVLEHFGGHRSQAAKALGIGTNTLWRKLKAWGVAPAGPTPLGER